MADTPADDQDHVEGLPTCSYREEETDSNCTGKRADGFHHCLAHLKPDQLDQVLQRLHAGADLDASGTPINAELLAQILRAVQGNDEHPAFGQVSFAQAHFTADAGFNGVRFSGDAHFLGTKFSREAVFEGAVFSQAARFTFAQFSGGAWFGGAKFSGDAYFTFAQFTSRAVFGGAQFSGDAEFGLAQFSGDVWFFDVRFENATSLGPLAAGSVGLDRAVFVRPLVIQAAAASVTCRDTTWHAGVTLRLRYAAVDLERATFTTPSFVTGSDQPFVTPASRPMNEIVRLLLNEDQVRNRALAERGESGDLWVPSLRSLRGSDAANLSVTDADLSQCRFAGALLLDQLRLEGHCLFDHPPRGLHFGWASPPAWRWSGRQSLAEERAWRASTRKYAGWADERSRQAAEAGPERLAGLYRQLRKTHEDTKNEPGAADFYYGEMEMRRHARSTTRAERLILALYWAISGYGLRATRALAALAALILMSAALLEFAGFPGHAAGYLDSLLYAAGSVVSLNLTIQHLPAVLTNWGDVIRILLRVAGPVCLGLSALALRGRVKR